MQPKLFRLRFLFLLLYFKAKYDTIKQLQPQVAVLKAKIYRQILCFLLY